jgi:hypothetical protein
MDVHEYLLFTLRERGIIVNILVNRFNSVPFHQNHIIL